MEKSIGMPPAIHSFLSWQKWQYSAPFSLRGKEKAAGGKKKTAKGEFASEQTSHPSPCRKRQVSSVSLFLLFPRESLRWIRAGALAPLHSPLKRPERGCCPFLDFPRSLVCAKVYSEPTKNAMQMRIRKTGEVIEILCVSFDFHTSNIQRAQTERIARGVVRSKNSILRSPARAFGLWSV